MKKLYTLCASMLLTHAWSQTPVFNWGRQFAGAGLELGTLMAIDNAGNSHNVVIFDATTDFDPGTGTNLISAKGGFDFAVTKLDASGAALWTSHISGNFDELPNAITLDNSGNVYVAGTFVDTVDFDPGVGTHTLYAGTDDVFVLKLSSSGALVWVKQFDGDSYEGVNGIGVDGSGNVITTGYFDGITDFNPGAGTSTVMATAFGDMFVSKLDNNGNFVYVQIITSQDFVSPSALSLDGSGNIFITGNFMDATDFDPSVATSQLSSTNMSAFVLKLGNNGSFQFVKEIGGEPYDIKIDGAGNILVGGAFTGTIDVDPGASAHVLSATQYDYFMLKLTSAGNFSWAHQSGTPDNAYIYAIAIDNAGSIYAAGTYDGFVDLDPGAGSHTLQAIGGEDVFLARYSANGAFSWGGVMAGTDYDGIIDLVIDAGGNLFAGGYHFSNGIDIDPGPGSFTLSTTTGFFDIEAFVVKLSVCDLMADTNNVAALCSGGSATLGAVTSGTVTWYATATGSSTLGSGTMYATPALTAGGYTYYAQSSSCSGGPQSRIPMTLTVHPLPQVSVASSNDTICQGGSAVLTLSGAVSYSVNGTSSANSMTVNPALTTTYQVAGVSTEGCENTTTFVQYVEVCSALRENPDVSTVLYPNPAHDYFIIATNHETATLLISDVQGRTLIKQQLSTGENTIKCETLPKGLYLVQVITSEAAIRQRLIIE